MTPIRKPSPQLPAQSITLSNFSIHSPNENKPRPEHSPSTIAIPTRLCNPPYLKQHISNPYAAPPKLRFVEHSPALTNTAIIFRKTTSNYHFGKHHALPSRRHWPPPPTSVFSCRVRMVSYPWYTSPAKQRCFEQRTTSAGGYAFPSTMTCSLCGNTHSRSPATGKEMRGMRVSVHDVIGRVEQKQTNSDGGKNNVRLVRKGTPPFV